MYQSGVEVRFVAFSAIPDGQVVRYVKIDPSFTYLKPGHETFQIVSAKIDDFEKFLKKATFQVENQKEFFAEGKERTCIILHASPGFHLHKFLM